ncbi:hypothetical protein NE237_020325 [Protea cynaroides]|uniref:60S ribosomal protein L27 n=1 Tax=Protea cynaroides TaxID=273540 RepID=A0A9Q0H973_9MAGN|nr:hypothetical protein NE237_020325 [Protea cynaroides]
MANTPTLTETNSNKRVRDDSEESEFDSPEAKRIRDNLFDILDDSDVVVDRNQSNQELASVMKSFEEEILNLSPPPTQLQQPATVNLASGGSQPDLGFLLEASDDELGLPPTFFSSSSGEEEKNEDGDFDGEGEGKDLLHVSSETLGFDQIWGFEDDIQGYESMGFGIGGGCGGGEEENNNNIRERNGATCFRNRPYGHCLIVGIAKYPKKVIRKDLTKKTAKKSRVKAFIKLVNYNHIIPTRYTLDVNLKEVVLVDSLQSRDKKVTTAKETKARLEERFKTGKNRWFFTKLKF